jgi:hypothetical protein
VDGVGWPGSGVPLDGGVGGVVPLVHGWAVVAGCGDPLAPSVGLALAAVLGSGA